MSNGHLCGRSPAKFLKNLHIFQNKTNSRSMRYLVIFMLLVGMFVFGKRSFHCSITGVEGKGPLKTETRSATGFHGVEAGMSGDVEIRVSENYSVEVQAQENLLSLLKTEVSGGILKVYFSENISTSEPVKVIISAPSFDALSVSGSGTITVMGPVQAEKMDISVSGSGDFNMEQASLVSLECKVSGSGNLHLAGTVNAMEAEVSGSGEIEAKQLTANELRARVSGSGSITAHVVQVLKADVAGSGNVYYTGDPNVQSDVSGSGNVEKI